jgi:phage shock protein PspC (stress-responsive transcriptional regulator)
MFCTHCGQELRGPSDNFCAVCGHETPNAARGRMGAPRRLYRLSYDKQIAGVCSGLAKYLDVDVTLIRVLMITGTLFSGGLLILCYLAAWILVPVDYGIQMPATAPASPQSAG